MTLVINNDMVAQVLTMQDTIDVLEKADQDLAAKEAKCAPYFYTRMDEYGVKTALYKFPHNIAD